MKLMKKFGKPKLRSELRRRVENSFESYGSDSGTLYIKDIEEGLTFERAKIGGDKYGLAVIFEEDNTVYDPYSWSDPRPPCGFQIHDEISLKEFNHLARDYLKRKLGKKDEFKKWLKEKLCGPIEKELAKSNFFIESMPEPGAPEKEWKQFNRAMAINRNRWE